MILDSRFIIFMVDINLKNKEYLWQSYKREKLNHAYLFCGPEGTGKLDLAYEFVLMVNGLENQKERVLNGNHPDIITVEPVVESVSAKSSTGQGKKDKKRKKDISIEQIKEAVGKMKFFSYESEYKFLIVKESERLTRTSANSLLKIMEEPPKKTIIILLSSNEDQILPTVRSRCQKIRFSLMPIEEIKTYLFEKGCSDDVAKQSAELSLGRIKLAEIIAEQASYRESVKESLDEFRKALKQGPGKGFRLVENVSQDKEELFFSLDQWVWSLRNLLKKFALEKADLRIQKKIFEILQRLVETRAILRTTNASEKIQLENFFTQIN